MAFGNFKCYPYGCIGFMYSHKKWEIILLCISKCVSSKLFSILFELFLLYLFNILLTRLTTNSRKLDPQILNYF